MAARLTPEEIRNFTWVGLLNLKSRVESSIRCATSEAYLAELYEEIDDINVEIEKRTTPFEEHPNHRTTYPRFGKRKEIE